MKITVHKGDIVTDVLFKHTGQDDDQLEADFYQLNPHVRGDFFMEETIVIIPEVSFKQNIKEVNRSWD